MSLTGAVVNALAISGGGAIGLLFRRGIPERVSKTVMIGLGLCVLYIGISGASACRSILIVIVSMTLGAAAGALHGRCQHGRNGALADAALAGHDGDDLADLGLRIGLRLQALRLALRAGFAAARAVASAGFTHNAKISF